MYNRLNTQRGNRLVKKGQTLTDIEKKTYGSSKSLRYIAGTREPIYPIGFIQCNPPVAFNRRICPYIKEGREIVHDKLGMNTRIMYQLINQKILSRSIEYFDNRILLYSAQYGKCFVTGENSQM